MNERESIMTRTILMFVCALAACGKPDTGNQTTAASTVVAPPSTPTAPAPSASAAPVQKIELEISSLGDTMTFDKTKLTAPAKSQVHLVFKNNAKLEALPHNWVLVHEKSEARVAADGLALGLDAGYVPTNDDVIAATPLAPPKSQTEITFTAPKYPGDYPYICTVPGHYLSMKGIFTVTP
jgi:azurin